MIIEVARIGLEGRLYEGEEDASVLAVDGEEGLRAEAPITYGLRAQYVSGELVVTGRLSTTVAFLCSRCAVFFDLALEEPSFSAVYEVAERTDCVDLTPEMREAILLLFPSHAVCGGDCKGLCSRCGINLNEGSCDCRPPRDNRWGALDELKLDA